MKAFPNASRYALHNFEQPESFGAHVHTLHKGSDSVHGPLALILSNIHNAREVTSAIELTQLIVTHFGPRNAPSIHCLSAQSSAAVMRGEICERLSRGNYSAIITLSDWAAHAIASEYERSDLRTPFLFTNMHEVSGLAALDVDHPAYKYTAGVTVKHPLYTRMLSLLKDMSCKATRAHVIVGKWQSENASSSLTCGLTSENIAACAARGIEVTPLYAYDYQDLEVKLRTRLRPETDLILTGDDSLALANADMLAHFAEINLIPVVSQSLEAVKQGYAALGCGVWGNYTNGLVAKNIIDVLENGLEPSAIALSQVVASDRVRFKKAILEKQGLVIPPQMMRALEARDIDDDDDTPQPLLYIDKEYAEL